MARREGVAEWQVQQTQTDTDAAQMPDGKQKQKQAARTGTKMARRMFLDSDIQWRLSTSMFPVHQPLSPSSQTVGDLLRRGASPLAPVEIIDYRITDWLELN